MTMTMTMVKVKITNPIEPVANLTGTRNCASE